MAQSENDDSSSYENGVGSRQQQSKQIARMTKEVSAKIATAQVVVTIAAAARQLIDNSLDAGAKVIDIRTKTNGFESLEVEDDGSGIDPVNFDSLCKPHSTSKLTDYSDFRKLSTLGFRGEALNALCALGSVTIVTRCESSLLGTKLVYDHQGNITSQTRVARSMGTTVTVENLFETLPVRRKELEKTSKKEFNRLLTTVQCFAISRPDVKFLCSNTVGGKKAVLICTPGKANINEVVINLFGGRSEKNNMLDIVRKLPNEDICAIHGVNPAKLSIYESVQLSGFISSCEHGFGRSVPDRQFIYVNQRPVDYPKVCRVVNEVYQQYNNSQYPTLVLRIDVPPDTIDVNVTPDKRTVFYEKERELLAIVRASVLATFQPILGNMTSVEEHQDIRDALQSMDSSYLELETSISTTPPRESIPTPLDSPSSTTSSTVNTPSTTRPLVGIVELLRNDLSRRIMRNDSSSIGQPPPSKKSRPTIQSAVQATLETFAYKLIPHTLSQETAQTSNVGNRLPESSGFVTPKKASKPRSRNTSSTKKRSSEKKKNSEKKIDADERHKFTPPLLRNLSRAFDNDTSKDDEQMRLIEQRISEEETSEVVIKRECTSEETSTGEEVEEMERFEEASGYEIRGDDTEGVTVREGTSCCQGDDDENEPPLEADDDAMELDWNSLTASQLPFADDGMEELEDGTYVRKQEELSFSADSLFERLEQVRIAEEQKQELISQEEEFTAPIEPEENELAEQELDSKLKKSDFKNMSVLGQFNNGFIITRLNNHLFIVDQHASDEKYNFERLQKFAAVDTQKMLTPQPMDFGAVQESALKDNIDIFRSNGFDFEFVETDSGGTCAYLTSLPVLKSHQFGKSDVDEILAMVMAYPGTMYRPSKLRKIFASNACRTSVMIGTPLNHLEMKKIVRHLATVDQPWNCPHGRPTLRHLHHLKK